MLNFGADIYTVSKMLGHREIATTQIYARVLDEKKRAAIMLFPELDGVKTGENIKVSAKHTKRN